MRGFPFKTYIPKKGFYTAFVLMIVTLIFLIFGLTMHKLFLTIIALISGIIGLYFTEKSYVPYKPKNKKHSKNKSKK